MKPSFFPRLCNPTSNYPSWGKWLKSAAGQYLTDWVQRQCDELILQDSCYQALQYGLPNIQLLKKSCAQHRFLVEAVSNGFIKKKNLKKTKLSSKTCCKNYKKISKFGREHETFTSNGNISSSNGPELLPFKNESMDLVVLPHTLDFTEKPEAVIAESARVLRPEGRIILIGFNPCSLWSVQERLARIFLKKHLLPRRTGPISIKEIKNLFSLQGLTLQESRYGLYRPLISSRSTLLNKLSALEQAGDRWWPTQGALYFLSATKGST